MNSTNKTSARVGKVSLVVTLAMVIILPASALMMAMLHGNNGIAQMQAEIAQQQVEQQRTELSQVLDTIDGEITIDQTTLLLSAIGLLDLFDEYNIRVEDFQALFNETLVGMDLSKDQTLNSTTSRINLEHIGDVGDAIVNFLGAVGTAIAALHWLAKPLAWALFGVVNATAPAAIAGFGVAAFLVAATALMAAISFSYAVVRAWNNVLYWTGKFLEIV